MYPGLSALLDINTEYDSMFYNAGVEYPDLTGSINLSGQEGYLRTTYVELVCTGTNQTSTMSFQKRLNLTNCYYLKIDWQRIVNGSLANNRATIVFNGSTLMTWGGTTPQGRRTDSFNISGLSGLNSSIIQVNARNTANASPGSTVTIYVHKLWATDINGNVIKIPVI